MAIFYLDKYFYADEYSVIDGLVTFTLKGATVLKAPLSKIKAYSWSLS